MIDELELDATEPTTLVDELLDKEIADALEAGGFELFPPPPHATINTLISSNIQTHTVLISSPQFFKTG